MKHLNAFTGGVSAVLAIRLVALVAILALFAVACGDDEDEEDAVAAPAAAPTAAPVVVVVTATAAPVAAKTSVSVAMSGGFAPLSSLDTTISGVRFTVQANVFDPLVRYNAQDDIYEPKLAVSWKLSPMGPYGSS